MSAPLQQQPGAQPKPTDDEINARFAALTAQREHASNQVVMLTGEAARLRGVIAEREAALAEASAELAALKTAAENTPDKGSEGKT